MLSHPFSPLSRCRRPFALLFLPSVPFSLKPSGVLRLPAAFLFFPFLCRAQWWLDPGLSSPKKPAAVLFFFSPLPPFPSVFSTLPPPFFPTHASLPTPLDLSAAFDFFSPRKCNRQSILQCPNFWGRRCSFFFFSSFSPTRVFSPPFFFVGMYKKLWLLLYSSDPAHLGCLPSFFFFFFFYSSRNRSSSPRKRWRPLYTITWSFFSLLSSLC